MGIVFTTEYILGNLIARSPKEVRFLFLHISLVCLYLNLLRMLVSPKCFQMFFVHLYYFPPIIFNVQFVRYGQLLMKNMNSIDR